MPVNVKTRNVSLTPELENFVSAKVGSGSYNSASEVVHDCEKVLALAFGDLLNRPHQVQVHQLQRPMRSRIFGDLLGKGETEHFSLEAGLTRGGHWGFLCLWKRRHSSYKLVLGHVQ